MPLSVTGSVADPVVVTPSPGGLVGARILEIRNAIVNDINTAIAAGSEYEFNVVPSYSLNDDEELQVALGVQDQSESRKDTDTDEEVYQFALVVRKKVDKSVYGEIDPLVDIATTIHGRYLLEADMSKLSSELAVLGQVVLVEKRFYPAIYNQHMLDATGFFQSTLVLTVREWTDR